jgi:phytoene/squalene synthetase
MSRVVLTPAAVHCRDLLRKADPDRLLLAELAPPPRRPALWALAAFNWEVARIPERVSEPMLGSIRRQWWRDAWEEIAAGVPRRHPVVEALAEANDYAHFDLAIVDGLLQAREAEHEGPPTDLVELEQWAQQVGGGLSQLEAQSLGMANPSAIAGIGAAWTQLASLRALPHMLRHGRHQLPVALLEQHRIRLDQLDTSAPPTGWGKTIETVTSSAVARLSGSGSLPPLFRGYCRLCRLYHERLRRAGWNPFDASINSPTLGRVWQVLSVRIGL